MSDTPLNCLIERLHSRTPLSNRVVKALLALPASVHVYEQGTFLVREGEAQPANCGLISSGYAFRQKLTSEGHRQILSVHMRGDMIDLQHLFLARTDHNVQALTRVEAINIDRVALQKLVLSEPSVALALWSETLVEASIYREWIVNVGRRDARARIAHLLCEFATRLQFAGLDSGPSWHLPMTQEQIGDAVGLTPVHVNRTLKALAEEGVIERNKRVVSFSNWELIRQVGDFNEAYLHLDQTDRERVSAHA